MALIGRLIRGLIACHANGTRLRAADWVDAVQTDDDAYAVQYTTATGLGWDARRWKAGGAGLNGPFSHSPVIPAVSRQLLGVEIEVALRLGRAVSAEDVQGDSNPAEWVDAMCISVECIASRWEEGLAAPELLRMADLQSNGGLLLGPWQPYRALDWAQLEWRLAMPGQPDISRRGGHSLADPAAVLPPWVRRTLGERPGALAAGTVVTTGAWGGVHPLTDAARAGSAISLRFGELGEFSFSAPA